MPLVEGILSSLRPFCRFYAIFLNESIIRETITGRLPKLTVDSGASGRSDPLAVRPVEPVDGPAILGFTI